MTSQQARPQLQQRDHSRDWPVPVALVALSAIPLAAGTLRLVQLAAIRRPAAWRRRLHQRATESRATPAGASL